MANTVFVLEKVREMAVETQDVAKVIRYINDYIDEIKRREEQP